MAFLPGFTMRNALLSLWMAVGFAMALGRAAIAHNVQVSQDVAATFHIEPNHNPRAGSETLAWFALTQAGGQQISLQDCACELRVFAEPFKPGDFAMLEPPLIATDSEGYEAIPGAKITFPKPGRYRLELAGKAKDGFSFRPFTFSYAVTVIGGTPAAMPVDTVDTKVTASPVAQVPEAANNNDPNQEYWLFGTAVLFGFGIASALMLKPRQ